MEDHVYIPATATRVKVTNIIDPFHLRIYEIEAYSAKIDQLQKKLHQLAKTKLGNYEDDRRPQIGDLVLIDNSSNSNVDLPAWYCRGIVGPKQTVDSKYGVFLPDYGIALNFWLEELKILESSSVSDEYLTLAIGIDSILPITLADEFASVSDHWGKLAIQFTREIICAATQTFFDHVSSDQHGHKYGELYLILDGEVVTLSKALICNRFARIITDDLMKIIGNPDDLLTLHESTDTTEIVHNGHNSPKKYVLEGEKEDSRYYNKSNDNQMQDRNTAVYSRAFIESSKKYHRTDRDHEILISSRIACEYLDSLKEADFPGKIHKVLDSLSLKRPMLLQGYVWPAVTRGLNVVAVATQKAGKTLSYLVPIVGMVAANETHARLPGSNGPLALILCESSSEVYEIHQICEKLLKNYPQTKVLPAYNGIPELNVMIQVYNGCEIFISTPAYLKRFVKNKRNQLNFSRLSHIVFDGVDVMFEKYRSSLGGILKILKSIQTERRNSAATNPLQMIITARHWTPDLRKFINFIEDPYVCIPSYVEAAVYAALEPKLLLLTKDSKASKVVELLDDQWTMIKTIIVCTSTQEAMELVEVLKLNSIDTQIVHDEMIFTAIQGTKESWMSRVSGNYFVIVCTDQVLSDLNIRDAERLIHYSISSNTKTQFFYRFSTLSNTFSCHIHDRKKKGPKPKCVMMADEENDAQLNAVVTVVRRLGVKIPPPMEIHLENIFRTAEMAKTDRLLCENVKAFGRCPERDSCPSRHYVVPEIDKPTTDIKTGDEVRLIITGTHSPNHYSARVIEYTRANTNERVSLSFQEFTLLTMKMQEHYENPSNRRSVKTLEVGMIYAIEEAPGNYKRVKILSIIDKDLSSIQIVSVRSIDDGDMFSIKACQLLELPKELSQWPSHILDIYLMGIVPYDNEPTWSPRAYEIVRSWFQENLDNPTSYVFGKVLLHLSHVLWVDPLEIRHKLHNYPDLVDSTLKSKLIDAECAMVNKEHIRDLLQHSTITS